MDKVEELLTRGVDKIYPTREVLDEKLKSGKRIRIYQGFDPTGTQLHIGHMIGMRKLRQWQDLGHQVIFLIGDGTGQAGDPSGKTKSRDKFFSRDELRKNALDYVKQAAKIVRFDGENPIEIRYNGDWLSELKLAELLDIAGHFTLQQLIERDLFQERIRSNTPVNMREFLYPLLQGYDSVAMDVDAELGGSDQTFNMLCGRQLVKDYLNKEKYVMTTPLLEDKDGRKIGKTEGNVIALTDNPHDLFAKIMALGDEVIVKGLEYLTDVPMEEIKEIAQKIQGGENPIQFKKQLAFEVVKQLHSEDDAKQADEHFGKETAVEVPTRSVSVSENIKVEDLLVDLKLVESKSEAKRIISQSGASLNDKRFTDSNESVSVQNGDIVKVGKYKIVKIQIS